MKNNNPPIDLTSPPPHYDLAGFQAVVKAAMAIAMSQINAIGTSGAGSGASTFNLSDNHG